MIATSYTMSTTIKRQPATRRPLRKSPLKNDNLHIIPEEDEPRASSSRSPSPMLPRLKRREANINGAVIRLAGLAVAGDDDMYTVPRPAPRPPMSDYDELRYSSVSPSPSTASSSPGSRSTGLPVTPTSSDDEFFMPSTSRYPHASVKPLVIRKISERPLSPVVFAPADQYESDPESDSEWYSREFSKVLSVSSAIPVSFPKQDATARPDSIAFAPSIFEFLPPSPTQKRRSRSRPLPFTPLPLSPSSSPTKSSSFPSAQLDPTYSRDVSPVRQAPPVPPIPAHFRSLSNSSIESPSRSSSKRRSKPTPLDFAKEIPARPPPRSSVPADFGFFDADEEDNVLTYYSQTTPAPVSGVSTASSYSQASVIIPTSANGAPSDNSEFSFEFDLDDEPMQLPVSFPGSPVNLEAEVAYGLEQLRVQENSCNDAAIPETVDDPWEDFQPPVGTPDRVLRSKWSTSTLASVREEDARRGASKLRLYFTGSHKKRSSKTPSSVATSPNRKSGSGFLSPSPLSPLSPSKRFRYHQHLGANVPATSRRRDSDIMIFGRGPVSPVGTMGVRRRGSTSSVATSNAGSFESGSSTSSSGLRRKPIPVEMFLRT